MYIHKNTIREEKRREEKRREEKECLIREVIRGIKRGSKESKMKKERTRRGGDKA